MQRILVTDIATCNFDLKSLIIFSYRLTVWTAIIVSNDQVELVLVDVDGISHNLTKENVIVLLIFGWVFYTLAIIFNLIYYKIHPSFTDFSAASIKQRLRCRKDSSEDPNDSEDIHMYGGPYRSYKYSSDDSEDSNDEETEL